MNWSPTAPSPTPCPRSPPSDLRRPNERLPPVHGTGPVRGAGTWHAVAVTTVRPAQPSDLARIARTATAAFVEDPLIRWFFPDDDGYATLAPATFAWMGRRSIALGTARTTDDGVAIGLFFPPGRPEPDVEEPADGPTFPELTLERFAAMGAAREEHTPPEEHWYLNVLATHPDWQRQGLGAAVIAPMAEQARADGLALFLETETPENVAYYSHLGFRVRSEFRPEGGPQLWGMILDP
jgi:ribosomal protein S18 acetylase RimI-like enzyme